MKILAQIERINYLDKLIRNRSTGRPQKLARRLGVSTSRVYQIIEELKLCEVPIEYSRRLESYYYRYDYELRITVVLRPLNTQECKSVNGGFLEKMLPYNFSVTKESILAIS